MSNIKFTVFTDKRGQTRWRAKSKGRIVASSAGDGYRRVKICTRTLSRFIEAIRSDRYELDNQTKTEFEV